MRAIARWAPPVALLVASLLLGAWWRASGTMAFREALARFDPDRVDAIALVGGRGTLRYERRGDSWRQVEPYEHAGDPAAIRLLLAAAADAAPAYRVALAEAPETARIADAPLTVELRGAAEPLARFRIGADHPAGLAWLAEERQGFAGPCAPEFARLAMAAAGGSLRDDRLFELAGADSDRVRLQLPGASGGEVVLERQRGGWRMRTPFDCRADGAAVETFLQAAARLRHAGLVQADGGDGAAHGLAAPSAEITIRTPDAARGASREETVQLGADSGVGSVFARQSGRPPVVSVEARGLGGLMLPAAAFVDPRACGARAEDVVAVRVLDADGRPRVHLAREAGTWKRMGEAGVPVDDRSVRELIRSLCEARAVAIAGDEPREEWRTGSVEIGTAEGITRTVTLWRLPDGGWAMTDGDGPPRLFPASLPMPIEPSDHASKR